MSPDDTPAETTPLPMPTEGGTYERLADGSLKRLPDDADAATQPPQDQPPARKTKAKE